MSSAEIRREALDIEKLRAEIAREREQADTLMRQRLNWDEQERFWHANADYWLLAHRQDRLRNWIALAAVAGTLGIAIGKFLL